MKVVFRVDSSTLIGAGHIIRCLSLASLLARLGAQCIFICRDHLGNIANTISESGFQYILLPSQNDTMASPDDSLDSATLLDCSWRVDAQQTNKVLRTIRPDWLIVDHYGLDVRWERYLSANYSRLMVIDDLANREHDCDILLDQNYDNRQDNFYANLAPSKTIFLLGTEYALIRKEFCDLRQASLERRKSPKKKNILVTMGGSDPSNDTGKVLDGFLKSTIIETVTINAVIGSGNPNREGLKALCAHHKNILLHIQTPDMARLMDEADCAITAGGSTTWERCVLGLPALVVVQSDDQLVSTEMLNSMGVHKCLGRSSHVLGETYVSKFKELSFNELITMSEVSATICDGYGSDRVADQMLKNLM